MLGAENAEFIAYENFVKKREIISNRNSPAVPGQHLFFPDFI